MRNESRSRHKMLDHLEHEVAQFYGALAEFTERDRPDILNLPRDHPERIRRNTAFEAFLLHARLLDDFLGSKPAEGSDDFWAGHLIETWTAARPLATLPDIDGLSVRVRINKQLAHLTTKRLTHKKFPIRAMAQAITNSLIEFVNQAYPVLGENIWQINVWLYSTWTTTEPPIQSGS
ncbi:hypothetical protein [Mycobacterium nebraskense]|uniref:Uncharacterized protein n=1 Tax=Mycobacterium nebraskense TaxID=244292 RepID=A0A0F5NDP8_9MYCO|nr:hypothetical protein [Mycobacterium nebraskense]KKC05022.1 hypothetical protein WU83_10560 [Mycobacterium nebraskense]KLO33866.1 hypothetical protein ABW17_27985 [Mycobacterium nebraskense]MBI2695187.1 hypothetical protein [Mycobacterium nebraskense]MCV7118881.1 hypothetical protein [Mycobacterium nebraskense]ORW20781.1 hypothetical protein AWC17_07200 [Mycobacterium nebraskense]